MLGRGICEKYQSRNEKFPEPKGVGNLVSRLVDQHALDFSSASSLKQQSADRHVAPLGHIILIPSGEATNTNFIVFALTRSGLEPTIYHTHYATDVIYIYM